MTINPLDILFMLDDEDIAEMEAADLDKLCSLISLDIQLEKEANAKSSDNRRNMC